MKKSIVIIFSLSLLSATEGLAFYNATMGRWLNRDPITERGGNNLYAFVANDPIDHYDLLGLTIPGMCAEAYPNFCPCKCISVEVTFAPGGKGFQWGWVTNPDGSLRYGNNMNVRWKVSDPSSRCRYFQREGGQVWFYNISNLNAPDRKGNWFNAEMPDSFGTCSWGSRAYTDAVGGDFASPRDDGDWVAAAISPPSITLECHSSDGTKVIKKVDIPSPPNPGKFPP